MVMVKIGPSERTLADVHEGWIAQQIMDRRKDRVPICVRVTINGGSLNMVLSTPACAPLGGGGRAPNAQERELFELWEQKGLNTVDFSPGNVISFLKQIRKYA